MSFQRVKFVQKDNGDHIVIKMSKNGAPYYHHGIYCGNERVVHYDEPQRCIAEVSLQGFVGQYRLEDIEEVCYLSKYPPSTVVDRARKLAEKKFLYSPEINEPLGDQSLSYDLFTANCEHFSYYCRLGEWNSEQVDTFNQLWFEESLSNNHNNALYRVLGKFASGPVSNKGKMVVAVAATLFAAIRSGAGVLSERQLDTRNQHLLEEHIERLADEITIGRKDPLAHINEQIRRNQLG